MSQSLKVSVVTILVSLILQYLFHHHYYQFSKQGGSSPLVLSQRPWTVTDPPQPNEEYTFSPKHFIAPPTGVNDSLIVPWMKQSARGFVTEQNGFVGASGPYLFTNDGKTYLDAVSGYGVKNLGVHSEMIQKVTGQIETGLTHMQSDIPHPLRFSTARRLLKFAKFPEGSRVYFTTGGNLAVEAGQAFIARYAKRFLQDKKKGPGLIVAFRQGYAGGSSPMANRITGEPDRRTAFEDFVGKDDHIMHVDHPWFEEQQRLKDDNEKGEDKHKNGIIAAIEAKGGPEHIRSIVIEGGGFTATSGGVRVPVEYMAEVSAYAKKHSIMILCDETYSGFGRTGKRFGFMHYPGFQPDVVVGAKGITNGLGTIGYVLLSPEVGRVYDDGPSPMDFGLTYFAPIQDMVATNAVLDFWDAHEEDFLLDNVENMGKMIKSGIEEALRGTGILRREVRQFGLLLLMDLQNPKTGELVAPADVGRLKRIISDKYFVITMGRGFRLQLTPPLVITQSEASWIISAVTSALKNDLFSE